MIKSWLENKSRFFRMIMKKKQDKIIYPVKTYRLSKEVIEKLNKTKPTGQSWNMFFKDLLNKR